MALQMVTTGLSVSPRASSPESHPACVTESECWSRALPALSPASHLPGQSARHVNPQDSGCASTACKRRVYQVLDRDTPYDVLYLACQGATWAEFRLNQVWFSVALFFLRFLGEQKRVTHVCALHFTRPCRWISLVCSSSPWRLGRPQTTEVSASPLPSAPTLRPGFLCLPLAVLRHNLCDIEFTCLKCAIPWFLV